MSVIVASTTSSSTYTYIHPSMHTGTEESGQRRLLARVKRDHRQKSATHLIALCIGSGF